jgi:dipeptidyl-peptidase-4
MLRDSNNKGFFHMPPRFFLTGLCLGILSLIPWSAPAQDLTKNLPGYQQYQAISRAATNGAGFNGLSVIWQDGGKSLEYRKDGKRFSYDIAARKATEMGSTSNGPAAAPEPPRSGRRRPVNDRPGRPERGRQYSSAQSPDGQFKAIYHDRNLWLGSTNNSDEIAITTDGSEKNRIKNGTASWVYGEELFQTTAIWWSSNSEKVAFYRFDESKVPDFYLTLNETERQTKLDVEAYPIAGAPNPVVDILIYDVKTKQTVRVDVRDGQPFEDSAIGHYAYGVSWSPDGRELLFHRTNRRQNIMEYCAADPATGKCRVIVREEWPASWVENSPPMRWLQDGKRFIWTSERTGWKNFYRYDLQGTLLARLTDHNFEVGDIVRVDETAGLLYYMAHDGDNPIKLQLHRVGLDGRGDRCLTDRAFYHTINFAPDGKHFVDVAQTHDTPAITRLCDAEGTVVTELARADIKKLTALGLRPVELVQFKAADGRTDLYGLLHFPSHFSTHKKYPLLVSVYAGPDTAGAHETFTWPNALTEYGFLVATFDSRSASGRGKQFLDSLYMKLGTVEIDDQAAGVRSLWNRHYVDRKRVGIFGTSYGGSASALCLLRYPEVFQAACSSSPVTDFRNYDSIYTERYMWLPKENVAGYDAASVMTYVDKLTGRLMLYYGTADNNVHPSNMLQLIHALQRAGKSFEVQVGPDLGHTSLNRERMMEFFVRNLGGK